MQKPREGESRGMETLKQSLQDYTNPFNEMIQPSSKQSDAVLKAYMVGNGFSQQNSVHLYQAELQLCMLLTFPKAAFGWHS